MKRFIVIGNPIAHSRSPEIHRLFAQQFGITLNYQKQPSTDQQLTKTLQDFFQSGGAGANITVPFKQKAWQFADSLSTAAQVSGCVNTLSLDNNGSILGDNTDGVGLIRDLTKHHHFDFKNKNILILGAGGACRGVIAAILQASPRQLFIANRTPEKAKQLVSDFKTLGEINACGLTDIPPHFELVINATSASLHGQTLNIKPTIFKENGWAYDMMYSQKPTAFMQLASAQKAHAIDGLGMLVEQAAQSFYLWHGILPETTNVIRHLRTQG